MRKMEVRVMSVVVMGMWNDTQIVVTYGGDHWMKEPASLLNIFMGSKELGWDASFVTVRETSTPLTY